MKGKMVWVLLLGLLLFGCGQAGGTSEPEARYDFDRDGIMETIEVEEETTQYWVLRVMEDGQCLWQGNAAAAHMGWNNIFAGKADGKDCLIQYSPYMSQGFATYEFQVFSLRPEGGEEILETGRTRFDVNFGSPLHESFEAGEVAAFLEKIHGHLENSTILLATQNGQLQTDGSGADFWLDDPTEGKLRESKDWAALLKEFSE